LAKFEEINQEFKRHTSMLERSIDEHKRLVRKREKELDQVKNEFDHTVLNTSSLTNKVIRIFDLFLNKKLFLKFVSVPNKIQK
jgi:predicted RNase H-like nuclease (RuvC/YqgF family)